MSDEPRTYPCAFCGLAQVIPERRHDHAIVVATGYCHDVPQVLALLATAERERDAARAALAALYALVEDGLLVRSTTNDHHLPSYVAEATRLTTTLAEARAALAAPRPDPEARGLTPEED